MKKILFLFITCLLSLSMFVGAASSKANGKVTVISIVQAFDVPGGFYVGISANHGLPTNLVVTDDCYNTNFSPPGIVVTNSQTLGNWKPNGPDYYALAGPFSNVPSGLWCQAYVHLDGNSQRLAEVDYVS